MVRIFADTTSGLPVEVARKRNIPYLPQIIIFGDESFRDDGEMDTSSFLQKLRRSPTLPKTAAPPPSLYTPLYKEYLDRQEEILVLTPTADMSGTFRSASVAAQDFPGAKIRVLDTRTIAGGLGTLVLLAAKWAEEDLDIDTIEARVREMASREKIIFLVDTLEYLHKGGRIGSAQALMGSILQVKPMLTVTDGKIAPIETQRTKRRALARLKELVLQDCPKGDTSFLTVNHCDAEEEAQALAAEFGELLGITKVPITILPPAIGVHAGPGVLEISYFVDKK